MAVENCLERGGQAALPVVVRSVVFAANFGRTPDANDPKCQESLRAIQSGQNWLVDTDEFYGNTQLRMDMIDMIEEFRRADCVIQTVDISGLTADTAAVERNRQATRAALFYVSNDTGGSLFQDANDFGDQLSEILERSSATYLLTFRADDIAYNGEFRRLKVKVDAPGNTRASYRQGYYAPRPFEALHPLEKALLASDAIAGVDDRNDLRIDLLAAPFRANRRQAYLPVIVEVNGGDLLAEREDEQLPVEFCAHASNDRGEMKDFLPSRKSLFSRCGVLGCGEA